VKKNVGASTEKWIAPPKTLASTSEKQDASARRIPSAVESVRASR